MTDVPVSCPVRRDAAGTCGEQRRRSRSGPGQQVARSAPIRIPRLPNWGWPSTRPPPGVAFPSVRRSLEAPCAHHRLSAAERAGPWWRVGGHLGADPPGFGTGLEEAAGPLCGGGFDARRAARPLEMASRRAPPVPVRSGNSGEQLIADLVHQAAQQLLEPFGIGVDTAAEMLVVPATTPNASSPKPLSPSSRASLPCPPAPG